MDAKLEEISSKFLKCVINYSVSRISKFEAEILEKSGLDTAFAAKELVDDSIIKDLEKSIKRKRFWKSIVNRESINGVSRKSFSLRYALYRNVCNYAY